MDTETALGDSKNRQICTILRTRYFKAWYRYCTRGVNDYNIKEKRDKKNLMQRTIRVVFRLTNNIPGSPAKQTDITGTYFWVSLGFPAEVEFIKLKAAKIYRFLQLLSHSRGFFARV